MANLKQLFDKARAASEHRSYVRGLLGKPDGTVAVADRPTHCYVRVSQSGSESVTTARNLNTVPNRFNLPVRMRLEPGAGYVIVGIDSSVYEAATVNDVVNPYGIAAHTHKTDSGLSYEIEAMRLEPGRVFPTGAWGVTVNPFRFYAAGAWQTYEGEELDLLANRPSTAGKHRLVVIAVDPGTNAATKTNGSDQDYTTTLGQADIDAISIGDDIPLCAVRLRADDSDCTDITRYLDAGQWRSGPALTFLDSEGNPADVTTSAADGTSAYAARRDHAHGIGDGVVTFAKLTNIAEDRLIGRDSSGAGDPEEVTVGGGLEWTGSGGVQRSALTGDVTASAGSGTTTIANDAVTNAKAANMSQATIKGRAAGAGTGDPTDLTAAQVAAIVGGVLYLDNVGAGNVGSGEDTLATYTIAAAQLVSFATLWFEAVGTYAANGNTKTLRATFGATELCEYVTTNNNGVWRLQGRVVAVGPSSERSSVAVQTNSATDLQVTTHADDLATALDLVVTGEATSDDDIVLRTLLIGWTAAP